MASHPISCFRYLFLFFLPFLFSSTVFGQTATIKGKIVDRKQNKPLPAASIYLQNAKSKEFVQSTSSTDNGEYEFTDIQPGILYRVAVNYIGYEESAFTVLLERYDVKTIDFYLETATYDVNSVVVLSPWQMEKVVISTSSTTVVDKQDLENEVSLSPVSALRKIAGVDLARVGVDQYELAVRGFNDYLATSTYVLTDYRHAANPSIGGNFFQLMPFTQIDLERIEVIRGPGSSLYGSGVDAGVVHFITKDPFDYPGTTLMVSGGERSSFQGTVRHAGILFDKLGYKIVFNRSTATDWELDPNDSDDLAVLGIESAPRKYLNQKTNIYGQLKFKFNPNTWLLVNAGFGSASTNKTLRIIPFRIENGENAFIQFQLNTGNYFAQAHYTRNKFDNGFIYAAPDIQLRENSSVLRLQQQYDIAFPNDRGRFIIGSDVGYINPETNGTLNGRYESDDQLVELGSYAQTTVALSRKFDITAAARMDYDNINKRFNIGPRTGVVFKPDNKNLFRAFYNKTFASVSTLDMFLDVLAIEDVEAGIGMRILGNLNGYHYQRNPAYENFAGTDLAVSSLFPQNFGESMPAGMFISPFYNQLYAGLAQSVGAGVPLPGFTLEQSQQLLGAINPLVSPVEGFSKGKFGKINILQEDFQFVDTVEDIEQIQPTSSQTFEIGYKGLLGERLVASADVYYVQRKNFLGTIELISPLLVVPNLRADFQQTLQTAFSQNQNLQALGYSQEEIAVLASLLTQIADTDSFLSALQEAPVGILQPEENARPGELAIAYANFGRVDYIGLDFALQLLLSSRLDVFANLSVISDNYFDENELNEPGTGRAVSANKPKFKTNFGFNYRVPKGFSINATLRYAKDFPMIYGVYVGTVDEHFLVDIGAGFDCANFINGLRFDVQAYNVFNREHRLLVGSPKIGRLAMARLTYHIPGF